MCNEELIKINEEEKVEDIQTTEKKELSTEEKLREYEDLLGF